MSACDALKMLLRRGGGGPVAHAIFGPLVRPPGTMSPDGLCFSLDLIYVVDEYRGSVIILYGYEPA